MKSEIAQDYLTKNNILFEVKNNGAHLVVEGIDSYIDYWPSSGQWQVRGESTRGFGARQLATYINAG